MVDDNVTERFYVLQSLRDAMILDGDTAQIATLFFDHWSGWNDESSPKPGAVGMNNRVSPRCPFGCFFFFLLNLQRPYYYIRIHIITGRGDRMKQAKKDAQELINSYRDEKQEEFNNMVLSKGGSEGSASAKLQAETNTEITDMQAQFQKNAQKAVDVLLSKCCEVSLEVPTARVRATQKLAGVATVM